jgi:leucyl-tRNA synthetase
VGGTEHATLHLLYARFWHQVLFDLGLVSTAEPFQKLFNQGMVHDWSYNASPDKDKALKYYYPEDCEQKGERWFTKEGGIEVFRRLEKMSKSKSNVVNPDSMCEQYGADALRLYELFMGPLEEGCEWETGGVAGTRRFLDRLWRLAVDHETGESSTKLVDGDIRNKELERALHAAIKKVTEGVAELRFNTAIADMMVFVNEATKAKEVPKEWFAKFVLILSPFAPHVAEELWSRIGKSESLAFADWPEYEEAKLVVDTITLAIQIGGKMRGTIEVAADIGKDEAIALARNEESVQKFLEGKTIRREIYVPGRLVNLVAN